MVSGENSGKPAWLAKLLFWSGMNKNQTKGFIELAYLKPVSNIKCIKENWGHRTSLTQRLGNILPPWSYSYSRFSLEVIRLEDRQGGNIRTVNWWRFSIFLVANYHQKLIWKALFSIIIKLSFIIISIIIIIIK